MESWKLPLVPWCCKCLRRCRKRQPGGTWRRWYVAKEARALGRGGWKALQEWTGMSRPTLRKGMRELSGKKSLRETERLRRPGAGRKRIEENQPGFVGALEGIMEETTAGDPMSHLRWTSKSTSRIAEE